MSVPGVLAAGSRHIPVIIHESDMTPGLANKIAMRKATKICCNFPETLKYLPEGKAVLTGSPIILPELLKDFQVVHLCGKGKMDESLNGTPGYVQFEYISEQMRDLFAISSIVISRAGANAICELLALKKPNLLIPLSANASRGDQILNANSFKEHGYSMVLTEEDMNKDTLLAAVRKLYADRHQYIINMEKSEQQDSIDKIMNLIKDNSK